jgi:DNA-binding NarL/FixJ family response regulator
VKVELALAQRAIDAAGGPALALQNARTMADVALNTVRDLLSVSPSTVETHRAHILEKLDIHNTAELVLYAVRRGVIS